MENVYQMEMVKKEITVTLTTIVAAKSAIVLMGGTGKTAEIGKNSA